MSYEQSPWFQTAKTLWIYARNSSEEYSKRSITNALAEAYTAGTQATQESLRARVAQLEDLVHLYWGRDAAGIGLEEMDKIAARLIGEELARAALDGRAEKGKGV